ncbi:MAG: ATP-binding cassette domain-containing protein, partial [Acidimicrobiia bacterium]|nr:ATP-binding cassette domain-containing protein [Acidimicrobiia bacterium]
MPTATISPPTTELAAQAVDATKTYGTGETRVTALDGVTVGFERARFSAIMGPSGSGKSTLMHCLAGLDRLSSGEVFLGDVALSGV